MFLQNRWRVAINPEGCGNNAVELPTYGWIFAQDGMIFVESSLSAFDAA